MATGCSKLSSSGLALLLLSLFAQRLVRGAVLSPAMDKEVADLHFAMEEGFNRLHNMTGQLQAEPITFTVANFEQLRDEDGLRKLAEAAQRERGLDTGLLREEQVQFFSKAGEKVDGDYMKRHPEGAPASIFPVKAVVPVAKGSPSSMAEVRKLEADFKVLQKLAFSIGQESQDNSQLSQHPQMNNYLQGLREFRPRLEDAVSKLEKELYALTGKQVEKPKRKKKAAKTIRGLSEQDIRASARKSVAADDRVFKTKAMDLVSTFQERQHQMQDKQRDLQREMDGPDWPKEDWPLSTADAQHVGGAEQMIQATLGELKPKMDRVGGLGRIYESGDESALELLASLNEMMAGYCEIIDRHVEAVKKVYRSKKKRKSSPSKGAAPQDAPGPSTGGTLRDRLMNFGGGQGAQQEPFAWLRGDKGSGQADPFISGAAGGHRAGSFPGASAATGNGPATASLASLTGLSSSLGSLGSLGTMGNAVPSSLGSLGNAVPSSLGSLGSMGTTGYGSSFSSMGTIGNAAAGQGSFSHFSQPIGAQPAGGWSDPLGPSRSVGEL